MQRAIKRQLQVGKVIETVQNIVIAVNLYTHRCSISCHFDNRVSKHWKLHKNFYNFILITVLIFIYYKALL